MAVRIVDSSADKVIRSLLRYLIAAAFIFADKSLAEDVLLTVNVKKPVALTSDKFLSYTLDPTVILTGDALTKNVERSVNMARALAPAYVRIGGPRSNSYTFQRPDRSQDEEDPSFTFTEANWIGAHRWANNAGLDVLACIAPQHSEISGRESGWDSRNALDLISFSNHMGFNTSWQLGYECQTRCDVAGIDIGRDVMRLRSMLDAFPRYSRSLIAGPDVVTYRTKQQQQYLQDYFNVAGTALSAITWHPDFASVTLDTEGVSMHHDNLAVDRDGLYRVVGRLISKKPLWLAESKPEECKTQFLGALVWTRRLGNAAKLGVQVLMRQPNGSNLFQPTPDYWVSVLHKTLVGREVLDTKIATGNKTHVHFYCQCTKPSAKYEKGSLTIFGINLTPARIVANLKGFKIKTVHKYILLPGFDAENRMFSETVLLNNEPLSLLNESELPEIKPAISSNSKGVTLKLPSGGIGFWVIPGLKIKSCGGLDDDSSDKMLLKKLTKRLEIAEYDEESANEEDRVEDADDEFISGEERRYSSKTGKDKRRKKHRFSEEDEAERRYRKLETKMDLEKLEKLLRRRDNHDDRKTPRGRTAYFGFEEKSQERNNDEDDDATGEEIRLKLEEYKNRLKEYENRKKNETKSRNRGKIIESSDNEMIDNEKIVEALTLISKMENAMKNSDKNHDGSLIDMLEPSVSYDVTSDLLNPENKNPEDTFLDELLKSEKIKRTSVPSQIEEQLNAIYQMLAEEKLRRQRNAAEAPKVDEVQHIEEPPREIEESISRTRRDTDKKFGDDPLGLRKEGLYRRRTKNEDVRDRRIDRRTRRKDKDEKKDGQPVIFDPRTNVDSNENNFYGFHQREPLKGFPEGDLFLTTGTSSEEAAKDYDYVRDDDGDDKSRPRMILKTSETTRNHPDPDDTTWVEDENTQLNHVPHEFFEDVKMTVPRVRENLKEYGELWEAESVGESHGDHQDHFNAGDEEATVEKIKQERPPDVEEDKRAKDTVVRKLIGYYENPRSHQTEETDYFVSDKTDKSRSGGRNSARIIPDEPRGGRRPSQEYTTTRKRVKDVASSENGRFTDFHSMHFGRSAINSAEEEPLYDAGYPVSRPAPRTKRSTDDLETILNREMIFQDDNNLKDCECRVNRGVKSRTRKVDRERGERRSRPSKSDSRAERRKLKYRDGAPSSGPGGRFDEDYMHTTRSKRQVELSDGGEEKSMSAESAVSIEYSSDESTVQESNSEDVSRETDDHIENINDEAHQKALDDSLDETKDLTVVEETANLAVESEPVNFERDNKVKRHNEAELAVTERIENIESEERKKLKSAVPEKVEALAVEDLPKPENPIEKSSKESEADQLFLGSEVPSVETNSEAVNNTPEVDAASTTGSFDSALQNLQTTSPEDSANIVGDRSNSSETEIAVSSLTATSSPFEVDQEADGPIEQGDVASSTRGSKEFDVSETPILTTEGSETTKSDGRVKLEDEETGTENRPTAGNATLSTDKANAKRPKLSKDNPRTPRKAQKPKSTIKIVDPAKTREARVGARSEALAALKKENETRKAKKPLETTSKLLSSGNTKFQSMQKKRAEQLEKLRDKLRTKRAKMVQEYRDELLDELNKTSNGEERNLKRREIIDMINHDDELRDLVDREKLDYIMLNKPIDYEKNDNRLDNAERRSKYVPEMIDIVRPIHQARERKVNPPSQSNRESGDATLMKYPSSDESTDSEAIRKALLEKIDLTDRKAKRRSGKIYYSVVESLENPRIYQYPLPQTRASGEEEFNDSGPMESTRSKHSSARGIYNVDDRMHDGIPESQGEKAEYSPRSTRMTSNRENHYMCRNENSNEHSSEDYLFDAAGKKDYRTAASLQDGEFNNNKKYNQKKKYLKETDYELNAKYESPKYSRLATGKSKMQRERTTDPRTRLQDHHHIINDNEESLRDTYGKNLQRVKVGNEDLEFSSNEMKEGQLFNTKIIDDLDLDEVLNSSKYELLMLIPVKNDKKSRSRRFAGNEIIRDEENSASNEIPTETIFKNSSDPKRTEPVEERNSVIRKDHGEDSTSTVKSTESSDINDDDNSISEFSTKENPRISEVPLEKKEPMVNGFLVEETVRSRILPKTGSLSDLFEAAIPRLEATVTGGLGKVRRISDSFEKFVDDFDDRFNNEETDSNEENQQITGPVTIISESPITHSIFTTAKTNVRKVFDFLSGIMHIFRFV